MGVSKMRDVKKKIPTVKLRGKKTVHQMANPPRWSPFKEGLTQGSLGCFLDCREQFRLKYVFGWRSKAKSGTTAFGSAFHDILAATQHSENGKLKTLDEAVDSYARKINADKLSPTVQQDVFQMLAIVKALIERYAVRWEKDNSQWKWEAREKTFEFVDRPTGIVLRGRFDGVFRRKDGSLWLLETKTKGRIDEDGIAAMLPHDLQTQLYCHAIKQVWGETPKGVVYDVIRNPQLRQRQTETSQDFVKRVCDDVDSRRDEYFIRWDVTFGKDDLEKWQQRFLIPALRQVLRWWDSIKDNPSNPWESPYHFMRPGAFWNQYGRSELFNALTKGEFFDLEQTNVIYPELVD